MRFLSHSLRGVALCGGLLALTWAVPAMADDPKSKTPAAAEIPTVDLLQAVQNGQVAVEAQGTGDGRMTLSVTNQSNRQLRVVLPPGLVASGATGQFGGMGGMGGGMGGGGGMMGGGGGMMGGMGGGGMGGGGMGGGGMGGGGMGGGGMGGGGGGGMLTMPPQMGMMMLGMLIMKLVGDRDSWDFTSLMSGMGGMGGMGMGGGMGGMGGGMGGMGGGMGGGMRSVPPTSLPHATLKPGQTRHLPTRVVSLGGPDDTSHVALPQKGEPLQIGDISQLTQNTQIQAALKRLAAEKAPETVAQLVMWRVAAGLDWATISQLAVGPKKWANTEELALARKFVDSLKNKGDEPAAITDSGVLYWEVVTKDKALQPLADALRTALKDTTVLGLKVEAGFPAKPEGPSVACRLQLVNNGTTGAVKNEAVVSVSASGGDSSTWVAMGKFTLPVTGKAGELKAAEVADATAEGVLGRLVRAQLTKGPKVKGKDTFQVRIDNASPLVLNGLALAGSTDDKDKTASLTGISLAPRRSLTINAGSEIVDRLGLKNGIRVIAADLSGL